MRGFRFRSNLYSERCAHICLAPSQNPKLFSRHVSSVESKRRYRSSRAGVDVAGRDSCRFDTIGCWLFLYWCSEDLNKRTPSSQDRFALRWLFWRDFSKLKSFVDDSSAKLIPSLHVISLAVRDQQWNELPDKFKITWRHSNRPIRWRP